MGDRDYGAELVGRSPALAAVLGRAERAARSPLPVLVTGESGTGKELLARFIHQHSQHRQGPYVVINCAGFPRELIDSALFGHERGAFTGARDAHVGCFVAANGGTLVLDEIGELPIDLQPKLLRVLEEPFVTPLGSRRSVAVNARIVAVTNRNLLHEAQAGRFRLDLYHRLCGMSVAMPPLRQRPDDLPLLVEHFANAFAPSLGRGGPGAGPLSEHACLALGQHTWPGNVRELRHLVWRAMALGGAPLDETHLLDEVWAAVAAQTPSRHPQARVAEDGGAYEPSGEAPNDSRTAHTKGPAPDDPAWLCLQGKSWEEVEAAVIRHHLRAANGNRRQAAATLGISRTTLYERLRKLEGATS